MARQVLFHLLPDDMKVFVDHVCTHGPVTIALRDSDQREVASVENPTTEQLDMILWNHDLIPSLERELVKRGGDKDYYRVSQLLPVLELAPSQQSVWKGRPSLLRGRLYGSAFDESLAAYATWYESLSAWIRKRFVRNPIEPHGYVGPAAMDWFRHGGLLMPWPTPPVTTEWELFVEAQDTVRRRTTSDKD